MRVGFKKPFKPGLGSYEKYDYNKVCGTILGPGIAATTTTFTCDGKNLICFQSQSESTVHDTIMIMHEPW